MTTYPESTFTGIKGLTIYYRRCLPEGKPRAAVVISHGLAEHGGRHEKLANRLTARGFAVYCLDHRGHGRSQGRRCYVDGFDEYVLDFDTFTTMARVENPGLKVFLFGQSMGATIATAWAAGHQAEVAGMVLCGAALKPGASISPALIAIGGILSRFFPRMGTVALDAAGLSHDQAVVNTYVNDPLVYVGKIPARAGYELIKAMRELERRAPDIRVPMLVLHGTADRLTNPEGSRMLYERAGSGDKNLKLYDGLHHELLNEPEGEEVLAGILSWLEARA